MVGDMPMPMPMLDGGEGGDGGDGGEGGGGGGDGVGAVSPLGSVLCSVFGCWRGGAEAMVFRQLPPRTRKRDETRLAFAR